MEKPVVSNAKLILQISAVTNKFFKIPEIVDMIFDNNNRDFI